AKAAGLQFAYLPVKIGQISDEKCTAFHQLMETLPGPVLAFCNSGNRARALYSRDTGTVTAPAETVSPACDWGNAFDIVIVGGGSAGMGVTASLLRRRSSLRIAIIEPNDKHYYQPAWTLVGGGAYAVDKTVRNTADVVPRGAEWIKAEVSG